MTWAVFLEHLGLHVLVRRFTARFLRGALHLVVFSGIRGGHVLRARRDHEPCQKHYVGNSSDHESLLLPTWTRRLVRWKSTGGRSHFEPSPAKAQWAANR